MLFVLQRGYHCDMRDKKSSDFEWVKPRLPITRRTQEGFSEITNQCDGGRKENVTVLTDTQQLIC